MSLQKFKSLSGSSVLGIAALVAVLLVGVVAIPPLRSGILSSLDAGREYLLFGAASDSFEFEESAGEGEGGTPKKRGTFRRIVTAPVRLFAGIFRRGGSKDSLAIRPASEKEIDRMKLIPMQRTRSSADLMADIGEPVDTEATVAHRAAQNLFDEAINQHDRGRLDAAIEKLAAATVLAPTFAATRPAPLTPKIVDMAIVPVKVTTAAVAATVLPATIPTVAAIPGAAKPPDTANIVPAAKPAPSMDAARSNLSRNTTFGFSQLII